MMQRVVGGIRRAHSAGWGKSLRIAMDRTALSALQKVFGFHPWHAEAPISARPYRRVVADLLDGITPPPRCVVEVGCGLGSILSLVRAPERHGYDLDEGAIRAARFLNGSAITFVHGDFAAVRQQRIDVLILVNWIHDVSPRQLHEWLAPLLPRTSHLVVDAIDADNPAAYRFRHDFAFLAGRVREIRSARARNEGRRFVLYEVLH